MECTTGITEVIRRVRRNPNETLITDGSPTVHERSGKLTPRWGFCQDIASVNYWSLEGVLLRGNSAGRVGGAAGWLHGTFFHAATGVFSRSNCRLFTQQLALLHAAIGAGTESAGTADCELFLCGGGCFGAYRADRLVDDDVKELIMVGSGFLLDDLAHALAGSGAVGQADAALFSG